MEKMWRKRERNGEKKMRKGGDREKIVRKGEENGRNGEKKGEYMIIYPDINTWILHTIHINM